MTTTVLKHDETAGYLADAGFRRRRKGGYCRGKLALRRCDGWAILTDSSKMPKTQSTRLLARHSRATGPWKLVTINGKPSWIAEFPLNALQAESNAEEPKPPLIQCLDWALETAGVETASVWDPPSEAEVRAWISGSELTIHSHRHVRQISLQCSDNQLKLSVPIVAEIPAELPESRDSWLRDLLLATQDQWRMVRVVDTSNGASRSAVAELDLTGAPHAILETLFTVGLQSLRYAVQWSVQSADLLVDLGVTCRAWEVRQPIP